MLRPVSPDPIIAAIRESRLEATGEPVLVAVSGGPDSTALLVAAVECRLRVVAVHYDHALREGSELVADRVQELCARLDVSLMTERRSAPMPRGSVQAGARALRYKFLESALSASGASAVALAHTADDVVEGAVLHLLRGCGLAGLRGMPERRGPFIRPMLNVWRSDVVDFLGRRGIAAYEDPSNSDLKHDRVWVRRALLPALEKDCPGIVRRFHSAAANAASLHERAVAAAHAALASGRIADSDLLRLPEPVAFEVLKALYARAGGKEPGLSRAQLTAMLALAGGGRGGRGLDLPGGLRYRVVDHLPEVTSSAARASLSGGAPKLTATPCAGCFEPQAAHLRRGLVLRLGVRRPGLRMRPVGGRGSRKLQDIFVDAHVPREDRDVWPLVFSGDRLAWVPGLAVDADHASRPGEPALHVTVGRMLAGRANLLV
ncbi:MAG: tRNA lysidine(34) synthetase TilS [Candidatus Dormibacterales bacterium]